MKKKNTESPPEGKSFQQLINHIWNHGLGNTLSREGVPISWSPDTFEAAFFDIGFDVDPRSFQNWRQGIHKADRQNIHAIAKVVSAGNEDLQRLWASAMFQAPKVHPVEDEPDQIDEIGKPAHQNLWQNYRQFVVGGIAALFLLFLILSVTNRIEVQRQVTTITDFKFCDESGFSRTALKCHLPSSHFPAGTTRVYVSFGTNNHFHGQPFRRKWYFESFRISSKLDFLDNAWPGYTFLGDGVREFDEGKYDLRIIIDGKTTTRSFVVGTFDPSKVTPDP